MIIFLLMHCIYNKFISFDELYIVSLHYCSDLPPKLTKYFYIIIFAS